MTATDDGSSTGKDVLELTTDVTLDQQMAASSTSQESTSMKEDNLQPKGGGKEEINLFLNFTTGEWN